MSLALYATYKINYDSIIKSQILYTNSITKKISTDTDNLLKEKVKTAIIMANAPIIIEALEESNLFYRQIPDTEREEKIGTLNSKWRSIDDPKDEFILEYTDNIVSRYFIHQQKLLEGEYGEIFLTNKYGALVASTSKLTTFSHGNKYWWLGAENNGEGLIFLDDRGFDTSVGGYVLGVVIPVKDDREIIGYLKGNLNIFGAINELISGTTDYDVGRLQLVRSGGLVVFEEGVQPLSSRVQSSICLRIKDRPAESLMVEDAGGLSLVGVAKINITEGEEGYGFGGSFKSIDHKMGNTGESWYIVCYRPLSVILGPIHSSIRSIFIVGIVIILILVFVAQFSSRLISKPLNSLNEATKKIGEGNFDYLVEVKGNDEFKNYANSLNSMANELKQSTTSIEIYKAEVRKREAMEEELFKSRNLKSIGILAGGIAHDFNNILTAIMGNVSCALMDAGEGTASHESLNNAIAACHQAQQLTQQILSFSSGGQPVKKNVSLRKILRESARFALHGSNVRSRLMIDDNLWPGQVDPGQISQVISNLVINADYAMPDGGEITIQAENIVIKEENQIELLPGRYIKIKIIDQGIGISDEDLPRIFDPYFTTEEDGHGLGLATTFSIVQNHRGFITADSIPDKGSTFTIFLPAGDENFTEVKEDVKVVQGEGRILIMDDDKTVLPLAARIVERLGYNVETAREGNEAIEKFKESKRAGEPFNLVILDLTIKGGMGGVKTLEKLREIDPDVKAIVSSGYSVESVMSDYKKSGFVGVIAKPYGVKSMNRGILEVMGG